MFDMNGMMGSKMMDRFFRKVDNVSWDLMSGKVGVVTDEGIVAISGKGEDSQIDINPFDQFGMPVPAFAQNTPASSVAVGDLIFQGKRVKGWVTEIVKKEGGVTKFRLMTPSGTSSLWTPPKIAMFGFDSGVMVLRSLMNMLPGGEKGLSSMQSMIMPMMMMGGDMDMDSMMPMMLFSQLGASGDGTDAMGMGGNMMQTMMMMQMMGGNKPKSRTRTNGGHVPSVGYSNNNNNTWFDD